MSASQAALAACAAAAVKRTCTRPGRPRAPGCQTLCSLYSREKRRRATSLSPHAQARSGPNNTREATCSGRGQGAREQQRQDRRRQRPCWSAPPAATTTPPHIELDEQRDAPGRLYWLPELPCRHQDWHAATPARPGRAAARGDPIQCSGGCGAMPQSAKQTNSRRTRPTIHRLLPGKRARLTYSPARNSIRCSVASFASSRALHWPRPLATATAKKVASCSPYAITLSRLRVSCLRRCSRTN